MDKITQAITILNQGGIVIFPTDTAFGIGCRMDNESAIQKLFRIRRRPQTQAASVLVSGIEMAEHYLLPLKSEVKELMQKYWPGGLTIIYPSKIALIPELVRAGNNLGVRMPDQQTALELISGTGVPILGPSANFHGEQTPYTFSDLNPKLIKLVDFVLSGTCKTKQASTVINCSLTPWHIIRQGSINITI